MHETWTVYQCHAKRLHYFHQSCFEKTYKSSGNKIQDTEVLKKARMKRVHTVQKLAQFRWTSHDIRMPDERLP